MELWPEVLAFAQPLAPVEALAALGPVAALLSAARAASPEEQEVAAAEAALAEVLAVAPPEVVAADGSLSAAFAGADSPAAVAALAAAHVALDFRLARPGPSAAEYFLVAAACL